MGFFSKVKQNLHHGGVKVQLQAPASVSMQDPSMATTVTVTASDQPAQIKSVKVQINAQSQNQGFSQPNANGPPLNNPNQGMTQKVAQAEDAQPFTLNPGESKTIQLSIVLNAGANVQAQAAPGSVAAEVGQLINKAQSASEFFGNNSYIYTVTASADVDGIALDPTDSHHLQILKPGEVGGSVAGVDFKAGL